MFKSVTAGRVSSADLLLRLYEKQVAIRPNDPYLIAHSDEHVARTQAAVFDFYQPYLPREGCILDWGCRHAPDACLMRAHIGENVCIEACDFVELDSYQVFYQSAGLHYTRLHDIVRMPYADATFDAVVGSGTLEHTAMDYESLKELYRVLKPDGRLIILYLPNRLSVAEWYRRVIRREGYHRRLYSPREINDLLKRTGFYPQVTGYQTRLDVLPDRNLKHQVLRLVSWVFPLHWLSSTICSVAVKVQMM